MGNTIIKAGAVVGPNTEVVNSTIEGYAEIRHSIVLDSIVGERTTVGPFAHLRRHAVIGKDNRIGNFVEVKESTTGE
jgi:bifunctional UDP-N-acetylglucosamine pyrophosphorylase / glucosamine-1-phosphate N-acetyltransferase